jgi:hypothetical protein
MSRKRWWYEISLCHHLHHFVASKTTGLASENSLLNDPDSLSGRILNDFLRYTAKEEVHDARIPSPIHDYCPTPTGSNFLEYVIDWTIDSLDHHRGYLLFAEACIREHCFYLFHRRGHHLISNQCDGVNGVINKPLVKTSLFGRPR